MTTHTQQPTIILIPGHWLGAWAWDEVLQHLSHLGHRATALTLPGLDKDDPHRAERTLDEQVAAIEQLLESETGPVIVVAHSGANAPVTRVLDQHPERMTRVVWVDSGPVTSGLAFAPDFPEGSEGLPLSPFDVLAQQASLDGLSAEALERFRARAVAEPGPVLRQTVELTNQARFEVPTTFVCCSMQSAQVRELAEAGHPMFAEVCSYTDTSFIDLPTGHWPMWSRPADLAKVLAANTGAV